MAKINVPRKSLSTHDGARAKHINAEQQLRRSVMSCLLWENEFYEDGESIASRIASCIPQVAPEKVAQIAIEARTKMHLRHVPLLLVRIMAAQATHRHVVARTLECIIQRTDVPDNTDGKSIVLVDDVLYTGRSIRAAMDAIFDLGRPQSVQLAVLIDRGHREMPIRADYVGKNIPSARNEDIQARLVETDGIDEVVIISEPGQGFIESKPRKKDHLSGELL